MTLSWFFTPRGKYIMYFYFTLQQKKIFPFLSDHVKPIMVFCMSHYLSWFRIFSSNFGCVFQLLCSSEAYSILSFIISFLWFHQTFQELKRMNCCRHHQDFIIIRTFPNKSSQHGTNQSMFCLLNNENHNLQIIFVLCKLLVLAMLKFL